MAGLAAAVLAGVGCSSTCYEKFDLTVALDEQVAQQLGSGASVKVDVVALSDQRAQAIEAMEMRDYWTVGNPTRQGLVSDDVVWETELSASNPSQTLSARDGLWNTPTWESGGTLLILADIPGVGPRGGMDPRRLALPRDCELWDSDDLEVTFSRGQPRYVPQEKAPSK